MRGWSLAGAATWKTSPCRHGVSGLCAQSARARQTCSNRREALLEEVVYDESGQLATSTFGDYALPRAADFPPFELERTVTPTPRNPLGAKGIGQAGTIGSTPAIVNAGVDALSPFGITHLDMPTTAEKIWRVMHS